MPLFSISRWKNLNSSPENIRPFEKFHDFVVCAKSTDKKPSSYQRRMQSPAPSLPSRAFKNPLSGEGKGFLVVQINAL